MLRFALLVFLIANAGYLAWSQGWMATLGWAPEEQSEPYRLKQQVRPEVLSIVPPLSAETATASAPVVAPVATAALADASPEAAAATSASVDTTAATVASTVAAATVQSALQPVNEEVLPEPTICLQTDTLDEAHFRKLQAALSQSDLPADSWQVLNANITARWMVYIGKFPNEAAMEKRRTELRNRKIAYDRAGGNLEPGLSLGRFSSEEAATRELGRVLNQGIRGARVVQERAAQTVYALRFAQVTAAQQTRLQSLKAAFQGKALRTCTKP